MASARERYALMIGAGRDNAYIARRMGVTEETVERWRRRLKMDPARKQSHTRAEYKVEFDAGHDDETIAKKFGLTVPRVSEMRMHMGYREPKITRQITPEVRDQIIEWCNTTDKPIRAMARELNLHRRGVENLVERWREKGVITRPKGPPGRTYTEEELEIARRMLVDEGTSYAEVLRTLGRSMHGTEFLAKRFPGYGWTPSQTAEYRHMREKLESL